MRTNKSTPSTEKELVSLIKDSPKSFALFSLGLISLIPSIVGYIFQSIYFNRLGINYSQYSELSDFFMAGISIPWVYILFIFFSSLSLFLIYKTINENELHKLKYQISALIIGLFLYLFYLSFFQPYNYIPFRKVSSDNVFKMNLVTVQLSQQVNTDVFFRYKNEKNQVKPSKCATGFLASKNSNYLFLIDNYSRPVVISMKYVVSIDYMPATISGFEKIDQEQLKNDGTLNCDYLSKLHN